MLIPDRKAVLGHGGFGIVCQGIWKNGNGEIIKVAVKRVQLLKLKEHDRHEEKNMKKLDHNNVVKLLDVEEDADFRSFGLELCDASLDHIFFPTGNPKNKKLKLPHSFEVLLQLVTGLEYIHSRDLTHRDVKPENVLISVDSVTKAVTLKWADFGLSRPVSKNGTYQMSELFGTRNWLAPELLNEIGRNYQKTSDGKQLLKGTMKSDIFPLGIIFLYYLNDGKPPYGTIDSNEIISNLMNQNNFIALKPRHSYVKDIILSMLVKEPRDRISSSEVLEQLTMKGQKLRISEKYLLAFCADVGKINVEEIKLMLEKGANVNCLDSDGLTPLLTLANRAVLINHENLKPEEKNHESQFVFEVIKLLTQYDELNVNCRQKDGSNALHILCRKYQNKNLFDIVKLLIDKGIDVNQTNNTGNNALNFLCGCYRYENLYDIVQFLIEKKIQVNCINNDQNNALLILCQLYRGKNLSKIVELLIKNNIYVNHSNSDGWNALLILCRYYEKDDLIDYVRLFVNNGIDIKFQDNEGWNALLILCRNYQNKNLYAIVKLLISKGIDVNSRNNQGFNSIQILRKCYNLDDFERLEKLLTSHSLAH